LPALPGIMDEVIDATGKTTDKFTCSSQMASPIRWCGVVTALRG